MASWVGTSSPFFFQLSGISRTWSLFFTLLCQEFLGISGGSLFSMLLHQVFHDVRDGPLLFLLLYQLFLGLGDESFFTMLLYQVFLDCEGGSLSSILLHQVFLGLGDRSIFSVLFRQVFIGPGCGPLFSMHASLLTVRFLALGLGSFFFVILCQVFLGIRDVPHILWPWAWFLLHAPLTSDFWHSGCIRPFLALEEGSSITAPEGSMQLNAC